MESVKCIDCDRKLKDTKKASRCFKCWSNYVNGIDYVICQPKPKTKLEQIEKSILYNYCSDYPINNNYCDWLYCPKCNVRMQTKKYVKKHINTNKHKVNSINFDNFIKENDKNFNVNDIKILNEIKTDYFEFF